jgi:hypothetical protein
MLSVFLKLDKIEYRVVIKFFVKEGLTLNEFRSMLIYIYIYRVIRKSLRDFRPLRYSNRDGNAEGEHVNRGRVTPSFCPTLQVLDMSTLGDAADVKFGNFDEFQDTERFFIPYPRHVSSRLPPSDKTCKYATTPSTQKKLEEILYLFLCSFLLCLSWLLRSGVRNIRRDL